MESSNFPLQGVIAIITEDISELDAAVRLGVSCVEIRPDLLMAKGMGVDGVMAVVERAKTLGLASLFTCRRRDHGGVFDGSHRDQFELSLAAADQGADVVDLEWDSQFGEVLIRSGITTILSHHDFSGTPDDGEFSVIMDRVRALSPRGFKFIPTAHGFDDAIKILRWVNEADENLIRIGFAMGQAGGFSRILTRCMGAPITYCPLGQAIAPGQISIESALHHYRIQSHSSATRTIGMLDDVDVSRDMVEGRMASINATGKPDQGKAQCETASRISVPITDATYDQVRSEAAFLKMDAIYVSRSKLESIPDSDNPIPCQDGGAVVVL